MERGARWAPSARLLALAAAVHLTGCIDLGVLSGGSRIILEVGTGDGQSGMAGWDLEQPIVALVRDDQGEPLEGVRVYFEVSTGGGSVSPTAAVTNFRGEALARWRLGGTSSGTQTVTAELVWIFRARPVSFEATATGSGEGDVVVVHGALAPLSGAVLSGPDGSFATASAGSTADTVFAVPPTDAPGRELVVFGYGNRPALVTPTWSPARDTVHVTLAPPVFVDIEFDIQDGDFADRKRLMETQLDTLRALWSAAGMGVTVGGVTFIDNTSLQPVVVPEVDCPDRPPGDRIRVVVVRRVGLRASIWGFACLSGEVVLTPDRWLPDRSQYLLAHEIGHTFALLHTSEGLMASDPNDQVRTIQLGGVFWAHFDQVSALNTIYQSQSLVDRRDCENQVGACPAALFPSVGTSPFGTPATPSAIR